MLGLENSVIQNFYITVVEAGRLEEILEQKIKTLGRLYTRLVVHGIPESGRTEELSLSLLGRVSI